MPLSDNILAMNYSLSVYKYMFLLLCRSKTLPSLKDISGYTRFMVGQGGLLRNLRQPYEAFFSNSFHPWDHQNQALIDQWKQNNYQPENDRGSEQFNESPSLAISLS